jgi:hypothetical protein
MLKNWKMSMLLVVGNAIAAAAFGQINPRYTLSSDLKDSLKDYTITFLDKNTKHDHVMLKASNDDTKRNVRIFFFQDSKTDTLKLNQVSAIQIFAKNKKAETILYSSVNHGDGNWTTTVFSQDVGQINQNTWRSNGNSFADNRPGWSLLKLRN